MILEGVIFDLDGTLVEAPYDWSEIKALLGTGGRPILSYLENLEEPERSSKWKALENIEREATAQARLKEGVPEFLAFLAEKRIKTALVTNNSRVNTDYLLEKFSLGFDLVISRESGLWKPSAAPLLAALNTLGLNSRRCAVIGDSPFDVQAAQEAEIPWIFILASDGGTRFHPPAGICASVNEVRRKIEGLLRSC